MTMLEYHQLILNKISFVDSSLFRKELKKTFRELSVEERAVLKYWFRTNCVCTIKSTSSA